MKKLIGNAIVGQSGGPTAAINATLAGVIRGVRKSMVDGNIKTLYGMKNGIEGFLRGDIIDLTSLFPEGEVGDNMTDRLSKTPAAALGSCRKRLPKKDAPDYENVYGELLELFKKNDIRYFFYIGGNDSMDTVDKLSEYTKSHDYEMSIIGLPKTIDNDLVLTDHTPGFGSAAKYIAVTTEEILLDCAVYKTRAVTIVEIMGRDAGWLTAASAVNRKFGGMTPDLVYLPEVDFDIDKFINDITAAFESHPNIVVAVSEGIHTSDGKYICEGVDNAKADAFGHKQLSGTGKVLADIVKKRLNCKSRSIELNISQRCGGHIASASDIEESLRIGEAAVYAAIEGVNREMMAFERVSDDPYSVIITHHDISLIANKVKRVPRDYINESGNNVADACIDYIAPLIRGESVPEYKNGIPQYFRF